MATEELNKPVSFPKWAEALAAVLRQTGAGLVLGSQTAGQAMMGEEYPLKNGQRLRVASTPIRLGDGSTVDGRGVQPDIAVEVSPQDEQVYYADAFKELRTNAWTVVTVSNGTTVTTNRVRRGRLNEAELVRVRRGGGNLEADASPIRESDSERQVVRDPALARALDVLKGLSVVRQNRF